MTIEPPRSSMSALMSVSGLRAKPLRRAGDRADEALGGVSPAGLVGQMPEAGEDFGEQPDAGRSRPVMRLARPRAGHVGGVARGEIEAARAVAEEIDRLARKVARGFEVARRAARLEQSQRGARHRGIIVEERAGARMALAPGVQEPPIARRAASSNTKSNAARAVCSQHRLVEHGAGAGERGDGRGRSSRPAPCRRGRAWDAPRAKRTVSRARRRGRPPHRASRAG